MSVICDAQFKLLLFADLVICDASLRYFDTVDWQQKGHPVCKITGYWFVGGDFVTAALHVL